MSDVGDIVWISLPSGNDTFTSYDSVSDADPFVHPDGFLNVPWFAPYYWRLPGLVGRYVSTGMHPGRVPVRALYFPECYLRFIIPANDLLRLPGDSLQHAQCQLLPVLYKRLRHFRYGHPVSMDGRLDFLAYLS